MEKLSDIETLVQGLLLRINVLEQENAQLREENAELKGRLGQNSSNSSRPPSSDGYRKQSHTEILQEVIEKKKRGGQLGHTGNTLHQVSAPDFIIDHKEESCSCGHHFDSLSGYALIEKRQVFEIPSPRITVYEHRIYETTCPNCGKIHRSSFSSQVKSPTQYGKRMKTFISLLNTVCSVPLSKISQLTEDLFGIRVNEGAIVSFNRQLSDQLEATDKILRQHVFSSQVVNADETGIRINKQTGWLHNYSTPAYTYLFAHLKRGMQAIEEGGAFLKDYTGWLIHDCCHPYFKLTTARHGLCNAHLLRELQAVVENDNRVWAKQMQDFLVKLKKTPFEERLENRTQLEAEYERICNFAIAEEPPPIQSLQIKKGRKKKSKSLNLAQRFITYKHHVLAFAFNENVPFTNNLAERDLRTAKIKMKVSNCFRSLQGAEHYASIASFISSARKNKKNIFDEIYNSFSGDNFLTTSG